MSEKDQTVILPINGDNALSEPVKSYDEFAAVEDPPADSSTGLVSLGFLKAAVRRSGRFVFIAAVLGFLGGFGVYVGTPHPYQAATSVLVQLGPYEDINTSAADNQALWESRAVSELVVNKLGLQQNAGSFLTTYKVTIITNRVLVVTASASSSAAAVTRANALATEFLRFRAEQLQNEQSLVIQGLNQQISQAQQRVDALTAQISQVSAQPASASQKSQLTDLQAERVRAVTNVSNLEQTVSGKQATDQPFTTAAIKGSVVLDAGQPLKHSQLKPLLFYVAIGLIAGLFLSIGIVILRALVSDKLRWRDEVALALGAPVTLSVGSDYRHRRLPNRRKTGAQEADVRRIAQHLNRAVPGTARGTGALAVVPVDDPVAAARSLVSLAVSRAHEGRQVVLADLVAGAPAARLLGTGEPGVGLVDVADTRLVVAVPERDELIPVGPLVRGPARVQRSAFTDEVAAAYASADLLLTLATLEPSLGGDYLSTWTENVVVLITAGRASWARIQAVGEMTRMSGSHLVSAVLTGADKSDETLGVTDPLHTRGDAGVRESGVRSDTGGLPGRR